MDIRSIQKPLKEKYRAVPGSSIVTIRATGGQQGDAMSCSVDIGRAIYQSQAHTGVGGAGTAACSGDLLLGSLAACAQITCQLVATALGIEVRSVKTEVTGDLDLAGTLGINKEASIGFASLNLRFDIDAPNATPEQLETLKAKTEQYCVVMQTLKQPPAVETSWSV
jgi:uncharacterized OsmC-like protein